MAKFATNVIGAMLMPTLSKLRSQFLGPLCLWQCFYSGRESDEHHQTGFLIPKYVFTLEVSIKQNDAVGVCFSISVQIFGFHIYELLVSSLATVVSNI